jgi:hypothetical protein
MKYRTRALHFSALVLAAAVVAAAGCGTISFFPTQPAQKAADKVIDDIWPLIQPTAPVASIGIAKEKEPPVEPVMSPKPEPK